MAERKFSSDGSSHERDDSSSASTVSTPSSSYHGISDEKKGDGDGANRPPTPPDAKLGIGNRVQGRISPFGGGQTRTTTENPINNTSYLASSALSDVSWDEDLKIIGALSHHMEPFVVVDPTKDDLSVIMASEQLANMAHIPLEEIVGKNLMEVFESMKASAKDDDDDNDDVQVHASIAAACNQDTFLCLEKQSNDNNNIVMQWLLSALRDKDSNTLFILLTYTIVDTRDIALSEPSRSFGYRFRKSWECFRQGSHWSQFIPYKRLCETDNKLVTTLQERQEMFCITDPNMYDNPIVFVSDNFVDMTGYSREEINGINCRFLQGQDTSQEDVDIIRLALRDHSTARVCLLNYRKDATKFINQFQLSPLRDVEGRVAFFIGVQLEVEDAEIYPFPNTRQTMAQLLVEEEQLFSKAL